LDQSAPPYDFSGQVVMITGASRGIGYAACEAFAQAGATLVALSQSDRIFDSARALSAKYGVEVTPFKVDITGYDAVSKVTDEVLGSHGRIDVLVNDAAIMGPTGDLSGNDPLEWARVIQVNVVGPFNTMKCVIPSMVERQTGSIINFSGGGAAGPSPHFSAYGCSKAAVVRLTETVAAELKDSGVRVNVIAPGANDTDMFKKFLEGGGKARTVVTIDKPVKLVLFLASEQSRLVSGKFIHVYDEYLGFTAEQLSSDLFTMRRIEPCR